MSNATHVILIHGLRVNRLVMTYLARYLRRHGFEAESWGYPSYSSDLEHCAALLGQRLKAERAGHVGLVAHSYGGVVALAHLARSTDIRVKRVVLLGSPIAGSYAGVAVARHAPGRWFIGATRRVWEEGPGVRIPEGVEVGSIAGTSRLGLGRFVTNIRHDNDGVVAVAETKLPGLADHLEMPVAHSVMLASPAVARQTDYFLRHGCFAR